MKVGITASLKGLPEGQTLPVHITFSEPDIVSRSQQHETELKFVHRSKALSWMIMTYMDNIRRNILTLAYVQAWTFLIIHLPTKYVVLTISRTV